MRGILASLLLLAACSAAPAPAPSATPAPTAPPTSVPTVPPTGTANAPTGAPTASSTPPSPTATTSQPTPPPAAKAIVLALLDLAESNGWPNPSAADIDAKLAAILQNPAIANAPIDDVLYPTLGDAIEGSWQRLNTGVSPLDPDTTRVTGARGLVSRLADALQLDPGNSDIYDGDASTGDAIELALYFAHNKLDQSHFAELVDLLTR
jgi:hypothetical protein